MTASGYRREGRRGIRGVYSRILKGVKGLIRGTQGGCKGRGFKAVDSYVMYYRLELGVREKLIK